MKKKNESVVVRGKAYMPAQIHTDIKKLMSDKGVTQLALALAMGIPKVTLMQNINGDAKMPVDRHEAVLVYLINYPEGN